METYTCNRCHDMGWISEDLPITDPNFGKVHRCPCKIDQDNTRWRKESGLTESQLSTPLSFKKPGPGTSEMIKQGRTFAENPIGTLFIHGSNGVGKTSMAYAMTSRMIDSGYRTVYTTGPNMFAWIRDGYGAQSQDETAMKRLDRLQSVRVLILDELDKVRPTDWVREIMSMFIDNRYRRRDELGTVVIANSPDNLSPDVVSRLMEGAVVLNQDADYRQRRQG